MLNKDSIVACREVIPISEVNLHKDKPHYVFITEVVLISLSEVLLYRNPTPH